MQAKPKGTFWYHSHVGAQRTNGVFGAFIIKEKPRKNFNPPTDVILQVGDWHHHSSEEVCAVFYCMKVISLESNTRGLINLVLVWFCLQCTSERGRKKHEKRGGC